MNIVKDGGNVIHFLRVVKEDCFRIFSFVAFGIPLSSLGGQRRWQGNLSTISSMPHMDMLESRHK